MFSAVPGKQSPIGIMSNIDLVIVGSIGLDTIETKFDKRTDLLGGSMSYACAASSFFARTGMVGVVGEDFPEAYMACYPLDEGIDPTGAGDSFAGGFMRYLAKKGEVNDRNVKEALLCGSVVASFRVEAFSLERLESLTMEQIDGRLNELKQMIQL